MQISNRKGVLLGILATILLEALGAGLWETTLRPGGSWFWHAVLTSATFGSQAVRNQVYLEAAKGNHESFAELSVMVLSGFLGGVLGSVSYLMLKIAAEFRRGGTHSTLAGESGEKARRILRYGPSVVVVLSLVMMVMFLVNCMKLATANELYTNFEQSLTICQLRWSRLFGQFSPILKWKFCFSV